MTENEISNKIIGSAIDIHQSLGPGLLESAYQECLCFRLRKAGFHIEKEKPMPLVYEEVKLDCGYRIDILVEGKVVIEIKSVEALNEVHFAQTLTYMKLGGYKLGLLINFNVSLLKDGIKRIVNQI
jgi:GxxExxY protein